MKVFLLFFVVIAHSLNAQILFHLANSFEKDEIQNSVIVFYADQLMRAGLFENEKDAREAALAEVEQELLDNDQIFCLLTSEDSRIQYGYLVYNLKDRTAFLEAIYLKEKYQGKGFGKEVLLQLEGVLLENEIHELKLSVFEHNKRAIGLYSKIGYEIETAYYINDKPVTYHMKKYL